MGSRAKIVVVVLIAFTAAAVGSASTPTSLTSLVDTRFGTGIDAGQKGNTAPFAGVPFANTFISAQTEPSHGEQKCYSPYYSSRTAAPVTGISGLRSSHWLSGSCMQDYGSVTVMPVTLPPGNTSSQNTGASGAAAGVNEHEWQSPFDHATEIAQPHYYSVNLTRYNVLAEATGLSHCGVLRFSFNNKSTTTSHRYIIVKPNSDAGFGQVDIDPVQGTVSGHNPVYRIYAGWGDPAGFMGHFHMRVLSGAKMVEWGTLQGATVHQNATSANGGGKAVAAWFRVDPSSPSSGIVEVSVCNSFTNINGALKNEAAELGTNATFDKVVEQAHATWETALAAITVDGGDEDENGGDSTPTDTDKENNESSSHGDRVVLYTAMYHALLHPRSFADVDGSHPPFNSGPTHPFDNAPPTGGGGNGSSSSWVPKGGVFSMDYSMWDIFRGQLPLLSIIRPESEYENLMLSLLDMADEGGGWMPIFPMWNSYTSEMVGDHACAILTDAILGGVITNYSAANHTLQLCLKNAFEVPNLLAMNNGQGRRDTIWYQLYGYVPTDLGGNQQMSISLEYFYDDHIVGLLAEHLGDTESAAKLFNRSGNWRYLLQTNQSKDGNGETGQWSFMRGRTWNGSWAMPDTPLSLVPWVTESTPLQYTWFVPHNVPGLIEAMGGGPQFTKELDLMFRNRTTGGGGSGGTPTPNYDAGNEPDIQAPYMFMYIPGQAWRTQQIVSELMRDYYTPTPDGLPGNDDAGAMSAWWILSALGFYPVCVGRGNFIIGTPKFKRTVVQIGAGGRVGSTPKTLTILAPKVSKAAIYVQ